MYQRDAHNGIRHLGQSGGGASPGEIIKSYPSLTLVDIQAAIAYAAELARERVVLVEAGQ